MSSRRGRHAAGAGGGIALVVGGASGIGDAVGALLARRGFETVVADVAERGAGPAGGRFVGVDLREPAQVDHLFERVHRSPGDPDVLVVTAGIGLHERLDEGDPEKWREVLEVNLLGALRVVRAFVPGMRTKGSGDVVLVSSVAARRPYAYGGVYAASKAGLDAAAEALRLEVLPEVRVTTIVPGVVDTRFFDRMIGGSRNPEEIGWGALEPRDVAEAVLFALERPRRVAVGSITIRPSAQPM